MSDADDGRLLEWARSFSAPPPAEAIGARLQSPAFSVERRALLLAVEQPHVRITVEPVTPWVHPVFELDDAPLTLVRVTLDGRGLPGQGYAGDGRTLWLDTTIRRACTLGLECVDGADPPRESGGASD